MSEPLTEDRIKAIVADAVAAAFARNISPQGTPGPVGPQTPTGVGNTNGNGNGNTSTNTSTAPWRPEELGFFDPDLSDDAVIGKGDIVYLGTHLYYRNVFIFVERIKDVAKAKGGNTVRLNLHSCLRGTALEWYSWKLTEFEKESLSKISLERGWITLLIEHFKERSAQAGIDVLASEGMTLGVKNSHAYNGSFQDAEFDFDMTTPVLLAKTSILELPYQAYEPEWNVQEGQRSYLSN